MINHSTWWGRAIQGVIVATLISVASGCGSVVADPSPMASPSSDVTSSASPEPTTPPEPTATDEHELEADRTTSFEDDKEENPDIYGFSNYDDLDGDGTGTNNEDQFGGVPDGYNAFDGLAGERATDDTSQKLSDQFMTRVYFFQPEAENTEYMYIIEVNACLVMFPQGVSVDQLTGRIIPIADQRFALRFQSSSVGFVKELTSGSDCS